eukprot:Pgem_evm1s20254
MNINNKVNKKKNVLILKKDTTTQPEIKQEFTDTSDVNNHECNNIMEEEEEDDNQSETENGKEKKKKPRIRRTFKELSRMYKCKVFDCTRSYASETALYQHMRKKHGIRKLRSMSTPGKANFVHMNGYNAQQHLIGNVNGVNNMNNRHSFSGGQQLISPNSIGLMHNPAGNSGINQQAGLVPPRKRAMSSPLLPRPLAIKRSSEPGSATTENIKEGSNSGPTSPTSTTQPTSKLSQSLSSF